MNRPDPEGVIAAIVTPVDAHGAPDTDRFLRHAEWLLSNGCDGLNVLGTTGEATSFSRAQRETLMNAAARLGAERMMVGTGVSDLPTTVALTRAAHAAGYAAALVLPPFYYKSVSDAGLHAYFAALVDATAATPIPIYLYNFPAMTGLRFSPDLVRALVRDFPDRIKGLKDSSGDLDYAAELAGIDGFAVFPSDETSLARDAGFAGCISATVNLTAPLAARLKRAPSDRALQDAVSKGRQGISSAPLIPAVKHLVADLHGDPGYRRPLPPLVELDEGDRRKLPDLAALTRAPQTHQE